MPIIRKANKKLYFAHVPFSAKPDLYTVLLDAGYQISNYGPVERDLVGVTDGVIRHLRARGISCLQKEGSFERVKTSLHRVTADTWSEWGPFDGAITILRDPLARLHSCVFNAYATAKREALGKHQVHGNSKEWSRFQDRYLKDLKTRLSKNPSLDDNRFRRFSDFVLPQVEIYLDDVPGLAKLEKSLGLEKAALKPMKRPPLPLSADLLAYGQERYAEDIALYNAHCNQEAGDVQAT